jgi:hypothetical protein
MGQGQEGQGQGEGQGEGVVCQERVLLGGEEYGVRRLFRDFVFMGRGAVQSD